MTCLHDDTKGHIFLGCFTATGHEIYLCECGALVNISEPKNYQADHAQHAMTAEEISAMVFQQMSELIVHIEKEVLSAQEHSLQEILKNYV